MAGLGTAINTAGVMKIENGALVSGQAMMVVLCIALGALVGEMINIEEWFERFGEWLKRKTGNAKDKNFVNGFDLFSWERMRAFRNSCFRVRRCDHVAGNTTETDHDGSRAELSLYDRFYFDLLCRNKFGLGKENEGCKQASVTWVCGHSGFFADFILS